MQSINQIRPMIVVLVTNYDTIKFQPKSELIRPSKTFSMAMDCHSLSAFSVGLHLEEQYRVSAYNSLK